MKDSSTFEDAIDDGVGEIVVVQHVAPCLEGLVGCEDGRAASVPVANFLILAANFLHAEAERVAKFRWLNLSDSNG